MHFSRAQVESFSLLFLEWNGKHSLRIDQRWYFESMLMLDPQEALAFQWSIRYLSLQLLYYKHWYHNLWLSSQPRKWTKYTKTWLIFVFFFNKINFTLALKLHAKCTHNFLLAKFFRVNFRIFPFRIDRRRCDSNKCSDQTVHDVDGISRRSPRFLFLIITSNRRKWSAVSWRNSVEQVMLLTLENVCTARAN